MKYSRSLVNRCLAASVLGGLVFGFVSCRKNEAPAPPQTITVKATTIVFTLSSSEEPTALSAQFMYEGASYTIVANRVNAGTQNGAAQIANNQVVPSTSTLAPKSIHIVGVKAPTYSNLITFNIDSFVSVYGSTGLYPSGQPGGSVDVTRFNKVMVLFTPDTQFWIYGNEDFPKKYGSDLEGLRKTTSKAAAFINDYQPTVTDEQRLPFVINVYK